MRLLITEGVKASTFKEFNCIAIAMLEWQTFFRGGGVGGVLLHKAFFASLFLHFQSLQVIKGDNKGNI